MYYELKLKILCIKPMCASVCVRNLQMKNMKEVFMKED